MFIKANNLAFSTVVLLRETATVRATLFQTNQMLVGVLTFAHSCATFVWSAVRVALVAEPSSFTSFRDAAYSALVSAGGGFGANCVPEVVANGITAGNCVKPAGAGAGCQFPGVAGKTYGVEGALQPSLARAANKRAATISPTLIPCEER